MIVFPREAMSMIKRAHFACLLVAGVVILLAWMIVADHKLEREHYLSAMKAAECRIIALDKALALREEHVAYLEKQVEKWRKTNWKPLPDDPKVYKTAKNYGEGE